MKILLKLNILFIVLLLFASCNSFKPLKIKKDLKDWNPYQLGDKHFFTNDLLTDFVEVTALSDEVGQRSMEWPKHFQEEVHLQIEGSQIDLKVILSDHCIIFSGKDSLGQGPMYIQTYYFKSKNTVNGITFHEKLQVGSTEYNNILVSEQEGKVIYYGKGLGLVGYEINDELYTRQ